MDVLFLPVMDAAFFLEMSNGGTIIPGILALALLTRYLAKEARRRGLHGLDWFRLPPSMDLVLAMWLFTFAVVGDRITKWVWRRFLGADDFSIGESVGLIFFGTIIVISLLCKVRALTKPDYGNGPWLASGALTALGVALMLFFR